jgi:hypothetical protein
MIGLSNTFATAAIAALMVIAGFQRRMLERREVRTCPACGCEIRSCRCR